MADGPLRLEIRPDGVALVELDDPDRRNVIGGAMKRALERAVGEVAASPDARVLVVAGNGPAFCGGADLPEVFGPPVKPTDEMAEYLRDYYRSFLGLLELTIPTIAAVHGAAIGAGLNLALACDLRMAGPKAAFGATFAKIGLHPGGGCTFFLVRALGRERALRVLLEGSVLDGARAVEQGLAHELVDDPRASALELGGRIAALDPRLSADIKRSVTIAARGEFAPSLEFETWAQAESAGRDEIQQAVARFAGAS